MSDRIRITYRLHAGEKADAEHLARRIALEQTVELPDGCYPERVEREIVGRVESVQAIEDRGTRVTISYPAASVGGEVPQLLNLLFGNVSFFADVEVLDLQLPASFDGVLQGPRFGIDGLRAAVGVTDRPLVCTAAKPVGLTSEELAERCAAFARGGMDVIKDDHSVTDQRMAPFRDRVVRCQEAVHEANLATGNRTLYFPNVTAPFDDLASRVEIATSIGCRGVVVSPFITGLDVLRWLAEESGLIVLAHPTFAGGLVRGGQGIAPALLFGYLLRTLGADGVIFLNIGGRFPVGQTECQAIATRLRETGTHRPAMPVPGGGIDVDTVPTWMREYGRDVMFLIGSSLYARQRLEPATRALLQAIRGHSNE
ncbi:MAG: RuBisCO large subunit C-terminal-like domain-containing protein [Gemmatimonadota bacterium]|nr:RuBisCO large subunit C-terminal-like domain-containing protein [Gemmatimonadota bacterium]MDH3478194.1 RuBisCO large subunit C-terminal-like domain-containing protein [Gemmatimonadota bacterium]MDH3570439.1 RuBisCO large subunit C-terminal-like domain-containing protein [Gemmatimonadota bacterium]MDH5550006.1 RuBisCO large subunit C-terminal-like domain-containing protein [Gemmatimonadota bacterium]